MDGNRDAERRGARARARKFELPGIQDLSKEQEQVLALPKEGQHLIVGGPGTGKTVVALLRARQHERAGDRYEFLVWNHLLKRASIQLFGSELPGDTWTAWFLRRFRDITGSEAPRKPPTPSGFRPIDWDGVEKTVRGCAPIADPPYLVIDEGQDMPPQFYQALVTLGFERFFVAADQNQRINADNSSRREIEDALAIETGDVIELKHNYRNCGPVARLARAFYTGDPASPPPNLPSEEGPQALDGRGRPVHSALLADYAEGRFPAICRRIARISDLRPRALIGVLAPNDDVRERYYGELKKAAATGGLDRGAPPIETFYGRYHRPAVRFDEGGILVINAQSCKGLEFDVAVLADIDRHKPSHDLDALRKRFYVMVARARNQVILLRPKGMKSRIDDILPDDDAVLQRG